MRLPPELIAALKKVALAWGVSYQDVVRAAITKGLPLVIKQQRQETRSLAAEMPELEETIRRPHIPYYTVGKKKTKGRPIDVTNQNAGSGH